MKRVTDIGDFVQFGATCKSWQSVVATAQKPCFSPCLMLTNDEADAQNLRSFYSLSSQREFTIGLPDIHGRRCWGSPYGWMVTFGLDLNIHLLNPFTGVQLFLPDPSSFPNEWIKRMEPELVRQRCPVRFSLSSNPSLNSQSCVVIALHNPRGKLSFAKPGDTTWTPIDTPIPYLVDAIYFNGNVYAVNAAGTLIVCDIHIPNPKGMLFELPTFYDSSRPGEHYLFEMSGELHVAIRYFHVVENEAPPVRFILVLRYLRRVTTNFEVHKLNFQTKSWCRVFDLGSNALFVGFNTTFVLPISEYSCFKKNAIYYTDDHLGCNSFCDMSVFDFEKKQQNFSISALMCSPNILGRSSLFLVCNHLLITVSPSVCAGNILAVSLLQIKNS